MSSGIQIGDAATWVAAGIAAVSAITTVWWPWHTRGLPKITGRSTTPHKIDGRMPKLIVACDNRRPFLFIEWRNDGDGTAHAITVKPANKDLDIYLMIEKPDEKDGFQMIDNVALLKPGQSFVTAVLPNLQTDLEHVPVILEYQEEPTRLVHSRVSKQMTLSYRLPALRPLDIREKRAAWEYLRSVCASTGYGSTDAELRHWAKQVLAHWEELDPARHDNPQSA
jgi:hypothetical protein